MPTLDAALTGGRLSSVDTSVLLRQLVVVVHVAVDTVIVVEEAAALQLLL